MSTTIPIQLAIQGGGARITHLLAALEAVQSLEREGVLRVTRIAGTSAGAIAGALLAAGVDMQRARDAFEAHRAELLRAFPPTGVRLRAAWCLLTRRPYWDGAPLRRLLAKLLAPRQSLSDLEIPLVIVAADLTNMQPCIYAEPHEPLISSLMDSAGIPFFLRTAANAGGYRVIVDGGVCENLPSEQLSYGEENGEVLGITFSSSHAGAPLSGFFDFARALIETALNASVLRAQLDSARTTSSSPPRRARSTSSEPSMPASAPSIARRAFWPPNSFAAMPSAPAKRRAPASPIPPAPSFRPRACTTSSPPCARCTTCSRSRCASNSSPCAWSSPAHRKPSPIAAAPIRSATKSSSAPHNIPSAATASA